jgi:hypothetical protein
MPRLKYVLIEDLYRVAAVRRSQAEHGVEQASGHRLQRRHSQPQVVCIAKFGYKTMVDHIYSQFITTGARLQSLSFVIKYQFSNEA